MSEMNCGVCHCADRECLESAPRVYQDNVALLDHMSVLQVRGFNAYPYPSEGF